MKRVLFISLFFLLSISSFGQKIRFSDSTNVWNILDICYGCTITGSSYTYDHPTIGYSRDTVVAGKLYRMLTSSYGAYFAYPCYIWEDTIAKKVFFRHYDFGTHFLDTVDRLLYNYNLAIGDTVYNAPVGLSVTPFWVSSIDSTQVNGLWYKIWHFNGFASYYNVIEGIGCTNRFDYPVDPYPPFENSSQLICFSNRSTISPLSNPVSSWGLLGDIYFDNVSSCLIPLKSGEVFSKSGETNIYPNPATSEMTVAGSEMITEIVISNLLGQTLYSQQYNAEKVQVDVANLIAGIYLIRINGTEVRMFVKE